MCCAIGKFCGQCLSQLRQEMQSDAFPLVKAVC